MLDSLFQQAVELADCRIDPGITLEIEDVLRTSRQVSEYRIEAVEAQWYRVTIKLCAYDQHAAEDVFIGLLHFIEYPAATFYTRRVSDCRVEYRVLSVNEQNRGFCAELVIT